MSSALIPKEKLSAYQRWEMASLNEYHSSVEDLAAHISPKSFAPSVEPLQRHHEKTPEEARAEAHAIGLQQGHAEGLAQGMAAMQNEVAQLREIVGSLTAAMSKADEVIAQDVMSLSLDVAQAVLKTALTVRPELVLNIVRDAIHYLPTLQAPARLFLHADDALLVNQHMGNELSKSGWHISIDAHLERGGCRVETGSNQIDASLSTRWQRLAAVLGQDSNWLVGE